jgi:hypothetical protein
MHLQNMIEFFIAGKKKEIIFLPFQNDMKSQEVNERPVVETIGLFWKLPLAIIEHLMVYPTKLLCLICQGLVKQLLH